MGARGQRCIFHLGQCMPMKKTSRSCYAGRATEKLVGEETLALHMSGVAQQLSFPRPLREELGTGCSSRADPHVRCSPARYGSPIPDPWH
eukprot:6472378-Amphidinium_carterae.1